jgi:hypothetical protein
VLVPLAVPVTTIGYVWAVALAGIEIVTVTVAGPWPFTLVGLNEQFPPVGNPEQLVLLEKFTVIPGDGAAGVTVMVAVAEFPAITDEPDKVAVIENAGAAGANDCASRLASTEPRPVTRL